MMDCLFGQENEIISHGDYNTITAELHKETLDKRMNVRRRRMFLV